MEFIKLFDTKDNYLAYRDGDSYVKPNVSYCEGNKEVYYNYPPTIIYDYVDLGLPSGTKWATMNVGAKKPSDAGLYFQWGDTQGYTADQVGKDKQFAWTDCKWRLSGDSSNNIAFTKYTTTGATLELEDDAAHVNMGGSWHMPTPDQIDELVNFTTKKWTTQDGVNGTLFTSTKDDSKSIFFPAAGFAWDGSVRNSGFKGSVWSSVLGVDDVIGGQYLYFFSGGALFLDSGYDRGTGFSVRGVVG